MKLLDAVLQRRSPRSFSDELVTTEQLALLFEAARWAPSSNNEQEWSYYYATRQQPEAYNRLLACLNPSNRMWASLAPMVLVSVGRKHFAGTDKLNRHWMHDVGGANVSLALQAAELGLQLHQMAGFSMDKCVETLGLNGELFEPVTMMVLGHPAPPDRLPDVNGLREREVAPRVRRLAKEFVAELK